MSESKDLDIAIKPFKKLDGSTHFNGGYQYTIFSFLLQYVDLGIVPDSIIDLEKLYKAKYLYQKFKETMMFVHSAVSIVAQMNHLGGTTDFKNYMYVEKYAENEIGKCKLISIHFTQVKFTLNRRDWYPAHCGPNSFEPNSLEAKFDFIADLITQLTTKGVIVMNTSNGDGYNFNFEWNITYKQLIDMLAKLFDARFQESDLSGINSVYKTLRAAEIDKKERKELEIELAKFYDINDKYKAAKTELDETKESMNAWMEEMKDPLVAVTKRNNLINFLKDKFDKFQTQKDKEMKELECQLNLANSNIKSKEESIVDLSKNIASLKAKIDTVRQENETLNRKYIELETAAKIKDDKIEILESQIKPKEPEVKEPPYWWKPYIFNTIKSPMIQDINVLEETIMTDLMINKVNEIELVKTSNLFNEVRKLIIKHRKFLDYVRNPNYSNQFYFDVCFMVYTSGFESFLDKSCSPDKIWNDIVLMWKKIDSAFQVEGI